jgi:DNA-binding SARP family transcriptional activator
MPVEFTVLGGVTAANGDRTVDLGTPQQRALLSLLLLARGRPVLLDYLIDQMWGAEAPVSARPTVRTYVTRLRHAFADAGGSESVIVTLPSGYYVPRTSGNLDLWNFEELMKRARAARGNGDIVEASRLLHSALSLWQGTALTGARGEFVDRERHRLEELRLSALEERIQVDLELGQHENLVAELTGLVSAYPLRERFHELLMLTLYRSGRQADALAAYHDVRQLLENELAISPGPSLQRMQRRILRADPGLQASIEEDSTARASVTLPTPTPEEPPATAAEPATVEQPAAAGRALPPTPAQLPVDIPDFVGRQDLMHQLMEVLCRADGPSLCALYGLDGMGKTTAAVHLAQRVRGQYPDGQLFVDLGGSTAQPADPMDVLGRFLRSIGCPGELPECLEERAALWRSYLNGRRLLIILDDAADGEQVRHLLPGSPGSAAIVTSIRRLGDVPALQSFRVDPLTHEESASLFEHIAGETKAQGESHASARLLNFAAGYPLALRMLARRVAERTSWRVADVVQQLQDELTEPPAVVATSDDYHTMHEAIWHSRRLLDPDAAEAFRSMRTLRVRAFSAQSIAALLNVSPVRALMILDSLAEVHLLERIPDCQYKLLDPVRVFAADEFAMNFAGNEAQVTASAIEQADLDHYLASDYITRRNGTPEQADIYVIGPYAANGELASLHEVAFPLLDNEVRRR